MTFAEKLTQIAENEQKVYDAGFEKGKASGGSGYDEGFADGKQAEYDAFWDAYQFDKGNPHSYQKAFAAYNWNNNTFKPKYDIVFQIGYTGSEAFWDNRVTNIAEVLEQRGLKIDTTLCGNTQSMFHNSHTVRIPELNFEHAMDYNSNGLYMTFYNAKVETIDKLIVPENLKYNSTFNSCTNLKNIEFEGVIGENIDFQWSTLLTKTSIESIIEHLSDSVSGKTLTLSKTAVLNAFELSEVSDGWLIGTYIEEWLALTASKSNWTISLV